ncbi:MAG: hypothetical protein HZC36_09360 [Armatimonadetes bacterium]|nr:hypothetical protein [Armatimonadota bacterium]
MEGRQDKGQRRAAAALAAALLVASAWASPIQTSTISFRKGTFTVRTPIGSTSVPIAESKRQATQPTSTNVNRILFRKDDAYAVWDSRGLSIRKGKQALTTRLQGLSVTPKLFTTDEILANRACFALGLRSPFASKISGAKRVGAAVTLLARWEDFSGAPWLEALIEVDLAEPKPHVQLLGAFEGLSVGPEGERLRLDGTMLAALTRRADGSWGKATWDPRLARFDFQAMGENLADFAFLGPQSGYAYERTGYGSTLLSRFHFPTAAKRTLMESRGEIKLLDPKEPWLALAREENGLWLHNLDSGSKVLLPSGGLVRRTSLGLFVASPLPKPESAALYSLDRFERVALWSPDIQKQQDAAARKGKHTPSKRKRKRH